MQVNGPRTTCRLLFNNGEDERTGVTNYADNSGQFPDNLDDFNQMTAKLSQISFNKMHGILEGNPPSGNDRAERISRKVFGVA